MFCSQGKATGEIYWQCGWKRMTCKFAQLSDKKALEQNFHWLIYSVPVMTLYKCIYCLISLLSTIKLQYGIRLNSSCNISGSISTFYLASTALAFSWTTLTLLTASQLGKCSYIRSALRWRPWGRLLSQRPLFLVCSVFKVTLCNLKLAVSSPWVTWWREWLQVLLLVYGVVTIQRFWTGTRVS